MKLLSIFGLIRTQAMVAGIWQHFNLSRLDIMKAGMIAKLVLIKDYPVIVTGRIITQSWKSLYLGLFLTLVKFQE